MRKNKLIDYLQNNQIGTRVMYPPLNQQKAYNINGHFPVSYKVGKEGLWLPSYVQLTDNDIVYISSKINEFYR